jgi:hypothetical protein
MATNNSSSGIGFFGLLAIAFIVLKLTNYIAWSWFWVLSPIWAPLVFVIAVLILFVVCWILYLVLKAIVEIL